MMINQGSLFLSLRDCHDMDNYYMNIDEPEIDDFSPTSKILSGLEYLCNIGSQTGYIPQSIKDNAKLDELYNFFHFNDDCDTKRRLIENYYVYIISAASDIEKIFYEVRRVNGDYMYFIESKDSLSTRYIEEEHGIYVPSEDDEIAQNIHPFQRDKKRGNLPKPAVKQLKLWLQEHYDHPYPSYKEKDILLKKTGLTTGQLCNWFINARRRIVPKLKEKFERKSKKDSNDIEFLKEKKRRKKDDDLYI